MIYPACTLLKSQALQTKIREELSDPLDISEFPKSLIRINAMVSAEVILFRFRNQTSVNTFWFLQTTRKSS